jgi:phosphate transport system substrate-binding protein
MRASTGLTVSYNSIGSGGGIRNFIADSVDFAGSDAPPKASDRQKMPRGVLLIPTAGGAVSVAYNNPDVPNLQLSQSQLSDVFRGSIINWNQISSSYPSRPITVVVRADGSGTTFIFTRHLSAISTAFRNEIGTDQAPDWPASFQSGNKNDGVAARIGQTAGAIGYVQDTYARQNNLATAKVQNKSGAFVEPTLATANQAMASVTWRNDFTVDAANPSEGYPIVGVTWLLLKTDYASDTTAQAVCKMTEWILTSGQDLNIRLEYTAIPDGVANQAIRQVRQLVSPSRDANQSCL